MYLAAAGTFRGKAGTASVISYTIHTDEVTTTDAFSPVAQGQLASSTTTLYTAPALTQALITEVQGNSTSLSNIAITFYINGTAASNLVWQGTVPAGGSFSYSGKGWTIYDSNGVTQSIGSTGPAGTIAVGSVTNVGVAGPPTVTNVGTGTAAILNFGLQQGATGTTGTAGVVQTVTAGDITLVAGGTSTDPTLRRAALTGDIAALAASNATTLATVNANVGSFGAANKVGTFTVNAKGLTTAAADVTITPAAIGSPSGSGTSSGTNTGDQTATTVPNTPAGNIAATNVQAALNELDNEKQPLDADLTAIAALVPLVGASMDYTTSGWAYNPNRYNVEDFGADPTNTNDSTVSIYNAIISCALTHSPADRATTTANATTSASFSISVGTNTLAASGTLTAMTTRGWVGFTYGAGGGTGTLTSCAITWGVAGGIILSTSIIGIASPYFFGGVVEFNAGLYKTTQEITNSIPGVWFRGAGAPSSSDVGTFFLSGGTFINYTGSAGGTVLRNVPITGTSGPQGGQALNGIRITGIGVLCHGASGYGLAGCGFQFISCVGFYLEDLYVYNATRTAYSFTTLGAAMLGTGQAHDCNRGTAINLRFREIEFNSGVATAAQASASGLTNPAATTNLNALSSTTITVSGAPNVNWPAAGTARFQARDTLTGGVMWYLVTYTSIAGSTLVGCNAIPQFWNETNSTTLVAATPSTSNPLPNATMFAGSLIVPAQGAWANGKTFHGSATANTCCNTFMQCIGSHFMGEANYIGNSDDNEILNDYVNRSTAGTPTGIGWDVQGGTAAGGVGAARNNRWNGGSWGAGGVRLRGTGDYSYTSPAIGNKWVDAQFANAEPIPVLGTGVFFQWTGNGLLTLGQTGAATVAAQATAASFTGFINGTSVLIPPAGFQIGTTFRWVIPVSKTLAGTTYSVAVRYGTTNVFATDTVAIVTQNFTGTAAVDAGQLEIIMVVVGPVGATAAALCQMRLTHNLLITGLSTTGTAGSLQVTPTMATFSTLSSNPGPAYLNVAITANAANVFTFNPPVLAEVVKIANP